MPTPLIDGHAPLATSLRAALPHLPLPTLILMDPAAATQAAQAYAAANPASLILLILHAAPPGLAQLPTHAGNAQLWAFTQQAALAWAPAGTRVNAIGLGASPTLPFAPPDQATQPAFPLAATAPAPLADLAGTIAFIAACPSLTGQIIRLGLYPSP